MNLQSKTDAELRADKAATFAENIMARQRAEALVELAGDECQRFWEEVAHMVAERLPPKPAPVDPFGPMDEQEAIRFEAAKMQFGGSMGTPIGELECTYLGWLAENDFSIKLRRYVKSDRFKRRQDEESDE